MRNIKMTMSRMQLSSKFVNNMLPKWGRFVSAVKLNRGLRDSNYDQLYAYLKQHEAHANESKMMLDRFTQHTVDPLALMYNGRQNRGQGNNPRGGGAAGYGGAQNRVGNANPALDEEQLLFLAGGQDNVVDEYVDEQPMHDLALNVDNMFQADDCDAFDSDVDEAPTTQTMFMENLSPADPVYDKASPSYDSDILSQILLLQEFDIEIKDRKRTENVAADHLSRIKNDETSDDSEVDDNFPEETLMEININEPWFTNIANYLVVAIDYVSKWVEAQALPTNDARVVVTFLKKLFCHFGMPKALISDRVKHQYPSGRMFPKEFDEVEKYVSGLSDMIQGSVMASNPKTMKLDDNLRNNHNQQQPFKRKNVARAYTVRPREKKVYGGSKPMCLKCNYHHDGQCAPKCTNCKRTCHLARDYRSPAAAANNQRASRANQRVVTCFECGAQGHYKRDCPKLKNNNRRNQAGNGRATTRAYAVRNVGETWMPMSLRVRSSKTTDMLLSCLILLPIGVLCLPHLVP
ncbi:integrase, catalytic region, zinc finger, CCHC-type containing protein [Tanacetum coccineum]